MVEMSMPFQVMAHAYSNSLADHPFVTKGITGFFLCGVGDIIAQVRGYDNDVCLDLLDVDVDVSDSEQASQSDSSIAPVQIEDEEQWWRSSIWSVWFYLSESLFNSANIKSASMIMNKSIAIVNIVRTLLGLVIVDQFVACPIIYGLWEIPVSTALNGAPVSRIPYEIKDKLGNLLIENAKVWTWVNILIYNIPGQYRSALASAGDIVWQSIVSDFAADCGNEEGEDEKNPVEVGNKNDPILLEL